MPNEYSVEDALMVKVSWFPGMTAEEDHLSLVKMPRFLGLC